MKSFKRIAIVPFTALGDITICLRLAQNLTNSGYEVSLFTNSLVSTQLNFPWLLLKPLTNKPEDLIVGYDIVLLDILSAWVKSHMVKFVNAKNVLLYTSKNYPKNLPIKTFSNQEIIFQSSGNFTNRSFCINKHDTKSMIDWVDEYGMEVLGVKAVSSLPAVVFQQPFQLRNLVVIFPTTPHPKKNFSIRGFNKLAKNLVNMGFQVEIIVTPQEKEHLKDKFENVKVKTFLEINHLIEYLRLAKVVISNDSGGGHLAAMLGIPTITITRKSKNFVWRPGYGQGNVVSPFITFKFGKKYIWRPFISVKKIQKITKNIMFNN